MLFADRQDAGRKLAENLRQYQDKGGIVLAIPRGGVPVGFEVAKALNLPLDIIVSRKIQIPGNSEAGFGAVSSEGEVILNPQIAPFLGLSKDEIAKLTGKVLKEIERRERVLRSKRSFPRLKDRIVILVDDGLAAGYTMLAAIKSVKKQKPKKVVVAVPVSSGSAASLIKPQVDKLVCLYTHPIFLPFAVASFYKKWRDLTDEDVLPFLINTDLKK
jgi:putative phosphoribosyl transferase